MERELKIEDVIKKCWLEQDKWGYNDEEILELENVRDLGYGVVRCCGDIKFGDGGWVAEIGEWKKSEMRGHPFFRMSWKMDDMLNEMGREWK